MKFTLESPSAVNVRSVSDTEILIGNDVWTEPVALTPAGVFADWVPPPVETLSAEDLAPLIATGPELIVVGTGRYHVLPNRELMFAMATPAAARTFNVLLNEGRSVAAVLYVSALS